MKRPLRIYRVHFEWFSKGVWNRNMFSRDVAVDGGAERAIEVAKSREQRENGRSRIRVGVNHLLSSASNSTYSTTHGA